jgi:hypothetical protein
MSNQLEEQNHEQRIQSNKRKIRRFVLELSTFHCSESPCIILAWIEY